VKKKFSVANMLNLFCMANAGQIALASFDNGVDIRTAVGITVSILALLT